MKDQRREILTQVAAGTLSAEEGAARLDSLEDAPPAAAPSPTSTASPSQPAGLTAARQVRVVSQFGSAEIVGDPSVAFAVAEGPHRARQDGDTIVVEHEPFDDADSFSFGRGRNIAVNGLDFQRRKLTVRMNPDLALTASVQAGNVRVVGVHGSITSDVQAGNCKVDDFRGALNISVQAGNVIASGRLESGASKVRCEMGAVKINLEKGSSVRITTRSTIGKVLIEGDSAGRAAAGSSGREVVIGSGTATLDVECTMGSVKVAVA